MKTRNISSGMTLRVLAVILTGLLTTASIEPGIAVCSAEEALFIWTGGLSTDWSTEGNWSSGVTPTSADDVTIPNVTNDPTISGTAICNNLIIEPSASLTIQAGAALTINGDLANSGILTLNSTLASSGSLIVNGTSTGNITYNRQLQPGSVPERNWHLAAPPVATNSNPNTGKINTIYQWSELTGKWTTAGITATVAGRGYNIHQETASDGVISFTGSLVNGDLAVDASSPYADAVKPDESYFDRKYVTGRSLENLGGKGWNLLGNPYPSAILAEDFIAANYNKAPGRSQFDPNYVALYLFDGADRRYYYIGNPTGWPGGGELAETHVQAGQGFFVLAMKDKSEFLFSKTMKDHSPGTAMLKSAGADERWPGLQLKVKYGRDESHTTIVYNEDMTSGLDPGYDVGLFNAGQEIELYTTLSLKDNSVNFARQALPVSGADTIIVPVGIDSEKGGEVTFSADLKPLGNYKFWLEDRKAGIFTNMNNNTYTVTLPPNTYGTGRFYIVASVNTPTGTDSEIEADGNDLRIWTSDGKVIIKGAVSDGALCEIFDTGGRKVMMIRFTDGELNTVTLPAGSRGVYLVRVVDRVEVTTRKVALL